MNSWLTATWKMLVVRGVLAIGFGILALVLPIGTVIALALLWGIYALVDGVMSLSHVLARDTSFGSRIAWLALGVIALVAAVVAITRPGVTAVVLTWLLGIWLIVRGLVELVAALGHTPLAPRWVLVAAALVDGLLGVLFVANPGASAVGVIVALGIFAIVWGATFLVLGVLLRGEARAAGAAR